MSEYRLELLVDDAVFGESPRWHEDALWFSDIGDNKVWRIARDGTRTLVLSGISGPSGLGWTRDGDLLVTSISDHTIYRMGRDGEARPFCGPDRHGTFGTNDMTTAGSRSYVSCSGRVYQMGDTMDEIAAPVGKVLLIDHETGAARVVADGFRMPNGIAFTPDGKSLVFSEVFASRLVQFDIEPDGSLSKARTFAALDGSADGIWMDAQGAVWSATTNMASGDTRFERIDATGRVLASIPVPDGFHAIACALGGEDGRDLFLVANKTETPDDVWNGRAKSRVFRTRVEVPTAPDAGLS
jgi:sugar lactone lactonase YvrE